MNASGSPLRILLVHNRYRRRGGEDVVFEREAQLLRNAGHEVETYERHNDEIDGIGAAALAAQTLWSRRTVREITSIVERFRPDVAHVHNTFPLISPSVYPTLKRLGVPIVQTLHNYRLMCLNAMLLREGRPCEDCVVRLPWRGVGHGCYRGSPAQSAMLAATLSMHRQHTIIGHVDRFIALTQFARGLFVRAGIPAEKIVVKPNFVFDRGRPPVGPRSGFLYVGRLSAEKGIDTLAQAARLVPHAQIDVIGDGPGADVLSGIPNVRLHGRKDATDVRRAMESAAFLLMPSVSYEGCPMTLAEAYEAGLPIIASSLGSLGELVEHGVTGLRTPPGDAYATAMLMSDVIERPQLIQDLATGARARYESDYSPGSQATVLERIYRSCMDTDAPRDRPIEQRTPDRCTQADV